MGPTVQNSTYTFMTNNLQIIQCNIHLVFKSYFNIIQNADSDNYEII